MYLPELIEHDLCIVLSIDRAKCQPVFSLASTNHFEVNTDCSV